MEKQMDNDGNVKKVKMNHDELKLTEEMSMRKNRLWAIVTISIVGIIAFVAVYIQCTSVCK
jgi:hypothetical protein